MASEMLTAAGVGVVVLLLVAALALGLNQPLGGALGQALPLVLALAAVAGVLVGLERRLA
ncbi:MAG TPA: hypothetical protein VFI42_01295 [Thermomicrobiaceae bacterium]|nr:hypothetical protein [Thermomicrobiaceae bacterium]